MTPQPSTPKGWNLDLLLYLGIAVNQYLATVSVLYYWPEWAIVSNGLFGTICTAWKIKRSMGKNDPPPTIEQSSVLQPVIVTKGPTEPAVNG